MESVKIRINTVQTIDEAGNEDVIELLTEAKLEKLKDCFIINYDESEITEQKGSRTRLKVYKDKMLMTKVGIYSSKMEFQQGKKYTNLYSTPYGSFDLVYNTVLYENKLNEKGRGNIYTEYVITFADSDESYNKLSIDII
ncbi:MAG: DUF1934 domain-containing protein [Bacillota bacterium]|jgi:uncharacterized beta-barrel protein YwiB (DUF1934 family)|nr:DUF1934 domain-containing protein [Bacillota bacterium]NLL60783.1 DUF1934 domain-containing protein [Tissierellia bacterium]